MKNLAVREGKKGSRDLILQDAEYYPEPETDLLLHFNYDNYMDQTGNYTWYRGTGTSTSKQVHLGRGSGYFLNNGGVEFQAGRTSLFYRGRNIEDFTIEFWMNPSTLNNEEIIFLWNGVNKQDNEYIPQKVKCYIEGRKIQWSFENFFMPPDNSQYNLKLSGKTALIPGKWTHHMIRYNSTTGLMEYLMNGVPEDIIYSTKDRMESPSIYTPYIGIFSLNKVVIGPNYRGFLDEFRISETFIEEPVLHNYKKQGEYHSGILDLETRSTMVKNIITEAEASDGADWYTYYRISNTPYAADNKDIPWKLWDNQEVMGRYIQIKTELYSGGSRFNSPIISQINLIYEKKLTPPAPKRVNIRAGKNSVTVSWTPIKYFDVTGYLIYYGTRPGNYTEVIDVQNANTYRIEGLKSRELYYFSVVSYSNEEVHSPYSEELYIRPE